MATWQLTHAESGATKTVVGVTEPVFVIQYGGKTYVTLLVQEQLPSPDPTAAYYQEKYDDAVQDPAVARRINIIEADQVHPVNVER